MNILGHFASRSSHSMAILLLVVALVLLSPAVSHSAPQKKPAAITIVKPEVVGLSADLSQKVHDAVQQHIDQGDMPGAVVLVARNGRVAYWEAQGVADVKTKMPLQKDTVFWMASMTKPVVATSILMMVEAGKISLDDPVSKFIPEFNAPSKVKVLKAGSSAPPSNPPPGPPDPNAPKPQYDLIPASRSITVKDLLTHTSGIQSIGVRKDEIVAAKPGETLATWVPRLGSVPLDFQPGAKWAYSNAAGFDVLARIVEVTSGQSFNDFVRARVFGPLGIMSSSFGPRKDLESRTMSIDPAQLRNPCINGITFFCGSAGLWMPADDYWRFSEMLLNQGKWNGRRLLSATSVEQMSSNQIGDLFPGFVGIPARGVGFGFSVEVIVDHAASDLALPDGTFGWNGVGTRQFWIVPRENMVIVMLLPSGNAAPVHRDIEKAVMSSISK